MKYAWLALVFFLASASQAEEFFPGMKHILFLGDSITHDGRYVATIETALRLRFPDRQFEILNLGLPSETVSGLSEPGHAGGKFPRPDLHERLDRVLEKTKPDLIIACYGMNDGIYEPVDDGRFSKFKDGIVWLHTKASDAGIKIIHVTPPMFDPAPIASKVVPADKVDVDHPFEKYDEVLAAYAQWLLSKRSDGWTVIDVHGPMVRVVANKRKETPAFSFSRDGVHPGDEGHTLIAQAILRGMPTAIVMNDQESPRFQKLYGLVRERSRLMSDYWLHETGHRRPGMAGALPTEQFKSKVGELSRQIDEAGK